MNIHTMKSQLLSQCEEQFYSLSAYMDRYTAESLAPVVVGAMLSVQEQVYREGLLCCDVGDSHADKEDTDKFSKLYADGIRTAVTARRNTYNRQIDDISNKLQLLKLI